MDTIPFTMGIPYVNRPDLLRRAVESVSDLWPGACILDNSEHGEIYLQADRWPIPVHWHAGISLTFSQSMNYFLHLAKRKNNKLCLMMHNDAEALPGTASALLNHAVMAAAEQRRWGLLFTHYDTLVAFNMEAVAHVGSWDTCLPQYFSDNDYYRRLRLAGWETIDTGLPVLHHEDASNTLKADPQRLQSNNITFPLYAQYYAAKWGGAPGEEQYTQPFNGWMS